MIHTIHFGKRVSKYRKELKMSQSQLAEKLGVTSQAISKQVCGVALPNIDLLLELSHLYSVSINELLEDSDSFIHLSNKEYKYDGIAYFVSKEEKISNRTWANKMKVQSQRLPVHWESIYSSQVMYDIA